MEKSSFAMAKFGLEPKEAMPKRDCGFYLKYIFLFTSLIQFLIILGLVLFMVYGNAQGGTDTHLRLLEERVQSHYRRVLALGAANANLSRALNATLKDRDKLQGLAGKVQRELEKCNSSQAGGAVPQLQLYQQLLGRCRLAIDVINTTCHADKLRLQRQLDQASSSTKTLEQSKQQGQAELAKATEERDKCQQELRSARTESDYSRTELLLQKHECRSVENDLSDKISEMMRQHQCGTAKEELDRVKQKADEIFRRQKEQRDGKFIWKESCELSVQQCQINCSREMQELQKKIQGLEKKEKEGLEEKKKLEGEKEKVGKELEEKTKAAAAQAEVLREQLMFCLGAKDVRGPGGAARLGSFPSSGSYLDLLRNPASLGKPNLDDFHQMAQLMEQVTASLKNSR
ncbi:hypothetical protein HGM15179_017419 [Zosterops borbonicus]|uniref:PLVAP protein n=1 Tax=Zosterops borbonicus TaxID=364589 RepID=A0A8K1G0U9_9PASS|nr:hypothetical protein HGM15179_017419 [Zosterops borbonicus]